METHQTRSAASATLASDTASHPAAEAAGQAPDLSRANLVAALERAQFKNKTLASQLSATEAHLQALLQSTSWRITAPLRNARIRLRRLRKSGPIETENHLVADGESYRKWISEFCTINAKARAKLTAQIKTLPARPLISVVMPSYNIDPKWMKAAIGSVSRQIYPHWELCISDDASTVDGIRELMTAYAAKDSRIKIGFRATNGHISANSNAALDLATGDYVALMDADDLLPEDALFWVAHEIACHPEVDLLFSDEDKIDDAGYRSNPYFKTAWNPALMLAQNAFSHLGVYRRSLVEKVGRFREGLEGSQDHDLVLRCSAETSADRIRHIPRVLYHWRISAQSTASGATSKPYAWNAGKKAIQEFLHGKGVNADINQTVGGYYQVTYETPKSHPLVSILMATTFDAAFTSRCIRSILEKTTYTSFELVVLVKSDHLAAARTRPDVSALLADPRVRLVEYEAASFNYSRVNNLGAARSNGEFLSLMNDDVEIISPNWLEHLVARAQLDGVGAVGPMLYYPTDRIQHAGVILGLGGVADHAFRNVERHTLGYFGRAALEQDYSALTAACLVIPREVFARVGGFDETLPVAFNDVDLSIRIRRMNLRLIWTPAVEMYHHESSTFGVHSAPARVEQFEEDVTLMRERWSETLDNDPYYNPNLSLDAGRPFALSFPPRLHNGLGSSKAAPIETFSRTPDLISPRREHTPSAET